MPRSVYAKISDLRAVLTDTTQYPDSRLLEMLEESADVIEMVTEQLFGPHFLQLVVDGLGARSVQEARRNKILEVVQLSHRRSDGTFQLIESKFYSVTDDARRVRLRAILTCSDPPDRAFLAGSQVYSTAGRSGISPDIPAGAPGQRFAYDDQNVSVDAVFGTIDVTTKHETTLSADLAKGALTASLADTGDIDTDDLLLIDRKFWVVVGALDTASIAAVVGPPAVAAVPGVVSFDPAPGAALAGAAVVRYGKIIRLIKQAAIRTALANRFLPGSEEEAALASGQRMKREKTDNYEIEFFQKGRSGIIGSPESGTGDPRADAILSRFRAPTVSGEWV